MSGHSVSMGARVQKVNDNNNNMHVSIGRKLKGDKNEYQTMNFCPGWPWTRTQLTLNCPSSRSSQLHIKYFDNGWPLQVTSIQLTHLYRPKSVNWTLRISRTPSSSCTTKLALVAESSWLSLSHVILGRGTPPILQENITMSPKYAVTFCGSTSKALSISETTCTATNEIPN